MYNFIIIRVLSQTYRLAWDGIAQIDSSCCPWSQQIKLQQSRKYRHHCSLRLTRRSREPSKFRVRSCITIIQIVRTIVPKRIGNAHGRHEILIQTFASLHRLARSFNLCFELYFETVNEVYTFPRMQKSAKLYLHRYLWNAIIAVLLSTRYESSSTRVRYIVSKLSLFDKFHVTCVLLDM